MGTEDLGDADRLRWRLMGRKVEIARQRIAQAIEEHGPCVVCCSGGKDGMVLVALAREVDPAMSISWMDDEIETPETLAVIDEIDARWGGVVRLWRPTPHGPGGWDAPTLTTWEEGRAWWRQPHPTSVAVPAGVRTGAWWMSQGRWSLVGTRGQESSVRRRRGWHGPGWSAPLHDWTDAEIWAATAGLELPICGMYGRLVGAGWPRDRCKTVPIAYALDGAYGPWRTLWPAEVAFASQLRNLPTRQQIC